MANDKPPAPIVQPDEGSDAERHEIFTRLAIKSVAELRKHLDSNSSVGAKWLYPPNARKARDYVISGMMNEVEKAAISSLSTSDFILKSQEEKLTEERSAEQQKMLDEMPSLGDNIYQSRIDEMVLWERKLTEQLVDIIGFKRTKQDGYYRHYIILREIERLNKISADFSEYHASKNQNIKHQLDRLKADADETVKSLDKAKCWYVEAINSNRGGQYKIASFKKRLNRVIPFMTPNQKITVGMSYGEYSVQSQNLHPNQTKIKDEKPSMKTLDDHFMRVTMLASEVVMAAKDAMSMHNKKGWLGDVSKMYKGNKYPDTLLAKLTRPDIEKGDFVVAYGDLAEVVKVNKSVFGYRGFRVRYLEQPPIPSIPVDEMPARYVHLYQKRKPIADQVVALLKENGETKPSTRSVNDALRKTIIHFWAELGGKERVFGKHEAAAQKMEDYVKKLKKPPK